MNKIETIEEDKTIILSELDIEKDCPVVHNFSKGVYTRTVFMPAGSIIVGKLHKTRHLNIILSGKARVWMDNKMLDIGAPDILESKEGCRKILYIVEDMYWTTIHQTDETDLDKLEEELIEETPMIGIDKIIKELVCLG